jgi:outer membrane protein OmpA-like peptidoglycan-associated protein
MKKYIFSLLLICGSVTMKAQIGNIIRHAKDKASDKANSAIDRSVDGSSGKSKGSSSGNGTGANGQTSNNNDSAPSNAAPQTLSAYQNYDFVPGDTVLFEDDFTADQDGEFPAHWDLEAGQAVVNKVNDVPGFFLTEGNYARVMPRMKTKTYLTDPFTIEFDYYPQGGSYGPIVFLPYKDGDDEKEGHVHFNEHGEVSTGYFPKDFSNNYPNENDDTYFNKWHHCAMIYKNNQLKCYIDQYRVLVVPSVGFKPASFGFGGIGDQEHPIVFKNVRAAAGGNMNMIGKKFTESKIVTHGITFDIDKSDIKPESMGTLNMIVQVMKSNPDIKFEIDGHTDNTGDAAHNMTLSQQRAEAVRTQLLSMGIDASRLSSRGFGDTKPIAGNDTPEGRANNRRVEFVKQ